MEFLIGDLVALLVLAVLIGVLLDCVVGEMDEQVVALLECELGGRGSNVAFRIPVGFDDAVEASDEHVVADIELPALVQQRLLYVLLQDEGSDIAVVALLFALQPDQDIVERIANTDPVSSIAELPGLDDPDILLVAPSLLVLLQLRVVVEEQFVLGIVNALDDVEGEWQGLKDVHLLQFVVLPHVVEEGLLVANEIVLLEVIVHQQLCIVLSLNQVFAGQEVQPFGVRPFVDDYLVLCVSGQVVVPVVQIYHVEYLGVEVVVGLQLRDGGDVDGPKRVDMLFDDF